MPETGTGLQGLGSDGRELRRCQSYHILSIKLTACYCDGLLLLFMTNVFQNVEYKGGIVNNRHLSVQEW